jgi:hypothetical protein
VSALAPSPTGSAFTINYNAAIERGARGTGSVT